MNFILKSPILRSSLSVTQQPELFRFDLLDVLRNKKYLSSKEDEFFTKEKVFGSHKSSFGGLYGALDPDSKRAEKHAINYYGLVRSMSTDTKRIANNTGFREQDIRRIKDHIFYKEHDLGNGITGRFDPDYEMSQSWQRLINGKNIKQQI